MVAVARFWVAVLVLAAAGPALAAADDAQNHSQMNAQVSTHSTQELAGICREFWEGHLRAQPTTATAIGDRRYDDRLADISPQGILDDQRRLEMILKKVQAVPEDALSPADRLTRSVLIEEVETDNWGVAGETVTVRRKQGK